MQRAELNRALDCSVTDRLQEHKPRTRLPMSGYYIHHPETGMRAIPRAKSRPDDLRFTQEIQSLGPIKQWGAGVSLRLSTGMYDKPELCFLEILVGTIIFVHWPALGWCRRNEHRDARRDLWTEKRTSLERFLSF